MNDHKKTTNMQDQAMTGINTQQAGESEVKAYKQLVGNILSGIDRQSAKAVLDDRICLARTYVRDLEQLRAMLPTELTAEQDQALYRLLDGPKPMAQISRWP